MSRILRLAALTLVLVLAACNGGAHPVSLVTAMPRPDLPVYTAPTPTQSPDLVPTFEVGKRVTLTDIDGRLFTIQYLGWDGATGNWSCFGNGDYATVDRCLYQDEDVLFFHYDGYHPVASVNIYSDGGLEVDKAWHLAEKQY